MKKLTGKVKWFDNPKGWGFIEGPHNMDVFVHYKNILGVNDEFKSLKKGQEVSYTLQQTIKGLHAKSVVKLI